MEITSDTEKKEKQKQVTRNASDLDIIHSEAFWQRAVKSLSKEQISETIETSENVSK